MVFYTIQDFWKSRLKVGNHPNKKLIQGWECPSEGHSAFKEAPLNLSAELSGAVDPQTAPIILVSAPGAVGKSTLARQIAFETGAVYVDLAKSEPVGANTMSGGLVKSDLFAAWKAGETALLIDGLDEARFHAPLEALSAFLGDIVYLAKDRPVPTVLFGRTGAIQDAWLILSEQGISPAVLEIGYYGPIASVEFAEARLRELRPQTQHAAVERRAIELLVERLRDQTEADGDHFAGYAPVLLAVAERVSRADNPAALVAQIESGDQPVTLETIVSAILERERSKLDTLQLQDSSLKGKLYLPEEQLDRLVARIYGVSAPSLAPMKPADAQVYSQALETWVGEHPFLDGGQKASSAVFEAVITTSALKNWKSANTAVQRELSKGAAANPFLAEFYLPSPPKSDFELPPEHIGVLYASLRARLSLGDSASLLVEGPEDSEDEEGLRAEVEISLARKDAEKARILTFKTDQAGVLKLGAYVDDVELVVPQSSVEIGPGREGILVPPISIQASKLSFTVEKVIVERPAGAADATAFLEAKDFDGGQITSLPTVRPGAQLSVSWPSSQIFPWTSFSVSPSPISDPRLDEALRRFRRFVVAFRSHSKDALARYRPKIDHARMTKGSGQSVLDLLVAEKIITAIGNMYYLDANALGAKTGATYHDCMARRFSVKTLEFVQRALK
jgi:hypothetical protein